MMMMTTEIHENGNDVKTVNAVKTEEAAYWLTKVVD